MLFRKSNGFNKIVINKNKKNYKIKNKLYKIYNLLMIFLLIYIFIFVIKSIDKKLFPSVVAITDKVMKKKINDSVSKSVNRLIKEMNLKSNDFYTKSQDKEGKINYLSVNTVLISELCSQISLDVSENLNVGVSKISIPLGILMGIESLSNFGPKYKVKIMPMGDTLIEYKTSFESVGINQINFQVWLDVNSNVKIINPLQKANINLKRKISLVNTIITGEVPITYFSIENMEDIKNMKKIKALEKK